MVDYVEEYLPINCEFIRYLYEEILYKASRELEELIDLPVNELFDHKIQSDMTGISTHYIFRNYNEFVLYKNPLERYKRYIKRKLKDACKEMPSKVRFVFNHLQ